MQMQSYSVREKGRKPVTGSLRGTCLEVAKGREMERHTKDCVCLLDTELREFLQVHTKLKLSRETNRVKRRKSLDFLIRGCC